MKFYILCLLLFSNSLFAQSLLEFNKSYIECEDRWIAYPGKDSSYTFGFVYIDPQAGPTMHYGGDFKITTDGIFRLGPGIKIDGTLKVRLIPGGRQVAIIPESKLSELKLPVIPDWLNNYKSDTTSAKHLYTWGYIYNEWDKPELALSFLERAMQIEPGYKDLVSELAYSYNATKQYEKAFTLLDNVKEKTCYVYKEFTYALIKLERLQEATTSCSKAMSDCNDKKMKAEIAYNIAFEYFKRKDKSNYQIWANETKKWAEPNDFFFTNIEKLDKKILY